MQCLAEKTSEHIDDEVKKIIMRCYDRTHALIEKNKDKLVRIAELLLEKEAVGSEEINAIVGITKAAPAPPGAPAAPGEGPKES